MASKDIRRYRDNLRDELDGATLYTTLAAAEPDPVRKDLFLQLAQAEAKRIAAELIGDKKAALDTLTREELGIDPGELGGNPLAAAATSFALFSAGAIFPVVSFIWFKGAQAIAVSVALSAAALCAMGLLTSLFNGRSPWFSAMRQAVFGCVAASVTYAIGSLLGVSLS